MKNARKSILIKQHEDSAKREIQRTLRKNEQGFVK